MRAFGLRSLLVLLVFVFVANRASGKPKKPLNRSDYPIHFQVVLSTIFSGKGCAMGLKDTESNITYSVGVGTPCRAFDTGVTLDGAIATVNGNKMIKIVYGDDSDLKEYAYYISMQMQ